MSPVLIVDDNLENLYLLRMLLQGHGYSVEEAHHGVEALAKARQQLPILIISDLLMPVMDGYTLLRQWKADDQLKAIPFMVYTATYTDLKDERLAFDLGADAFLVKPAEPEALMASITALLANLDPAQSSVRQPQIEENALLKDYSEALFRKLEQKVEGLQQTNRRLEAEIAERERTEAALRASEVRYRQLFQAITDPLLVYDRTTLICLAVNDAAVAEYGYSRDQFLTMTIRDLYHAEDVPALMARLAQSGSSLERRGVWRHQRKTGEIINVEISAYGLTFANHSACLVQARNITEQQRLEEQFRQAQKMEAIGRLAGGIAHDFNNLITVIKGYSELLQSRMAGDDSAAQLLGEIYQAGERAGALTSQLLAFSRQQVLAPQALNLNTVVSNTETMLRRLIGEDVILATTLSPTLGPIKADPGQIEQVLMNLAVNARDAMPQGGTLTLATQTVQLDEAFCRTVADLSPGDYVLLTVSDTGCGIDAATQVKMFEPFFTTKPVGKGTGLGLATVHGIVKQSGGYIAVESAVGQGTRFQIYLPLVAEPVSEGRSQGRSSTLPQGTETILVVEDEDAVRALEIHILRRCGYQVLEATNGQDALHLMEHEPGPIHLLLSDVVMPHLGGRELAAQVTRTQPQCKVLFLSGYTDDAVIHHGVSKADVAFLQKPFTPSALAQKVRQVLDGEAGSRV
ncbi:MULTISPECIES: hybrid sensor histidine kinase/response regulator [Cyanophyceae]|uniref:histidine kinase n=1 Tax=Leptolyngbya subtilissima DQ-A4 TaxID=2933933 RepID=A0ABV0K3J3_9CYAN|nr:response regulator [Nodosilinea sp. FACHB-141]MBD2113278.1 response regulator [Nodosilinea sp. FACHB-141]